MKIATEWNRLRQSGARGWGCVLAVILMAQAASVADESTEVGPVYQLLPSGAVKPTGDWKRTAESIADGWLRTVVEHEDDTVVTPFIVRNAFVGDYGDGHTEGAGYVADAITRFSHLLPESTVGKGKGKWLRRILGTQDEDGYLGCSKPENRFRGGFELWSIALLLETLVCEYDASGDKQVLAAARRSARWIAKEVKDGYLRGIYSGVGREKRGGQASHSVYCVVPLYQLWKRTGDESLREAAVHLLEDYEKSGSKLTSQAFLHKGQDSFREHIVGISMQIRVMAYASALTGNPRYLEAAKAIQKKLTARGISASGIIAGNEFTHKGGPRKWSEHCGSVEWTISNAEMVAFTGEVAYADAAERCLWNAYFGAKSADAMLLAYNSAPNQIVATNKTGPYEDNGDQAWNRAFYSAKHLYGCCNYNTSRAFPNFVQRAAMETGDGGLAVVFYGAWNMEHGAWKLALETQYPFSDEVVIRVNDAPSGKPLRLRIPAWCKGASLVHNGAKVDVSLTPGTFATVEAPLKSGDELRLRLEVPFELDVYDGSFASVPGFALRRGPLTFVLPIEEVATPVEIHDPWNPEHTCIHRNITPQEGACWNVALDLPLEKPVAGLELRRAAGLSGGFASAEAPLSVAVPVRVVPGWNPDIVSGHTSTPALPHPPMQRGSETKSVDFVPYGFTKIRMTYLPMVGVQNTRKFPWGAVELSQEK